MLSTKTAQPPWLCNVQAVLDSQASLDRNLDSRIHSCTQTIHPNSHGSLKLTARDSLSLESSTSAAAVAAMHALPLLRDMGSANLSFSSRPSRASPDDSSGNHTHVSSDFHLLKLDSTPDSPEQCSAQKDVQQDHPLDLTQQPSSEPSSQQQHLSTQQSLNGSRDSRYTSEEIDAASIMLLLQHTHPTTPFGYDQYADDQAAAAAAAAEAEAATTEATEAITEANHAYSADAEHMYGSNDSYMWEEQGTLYPTYSESWAAVSSAEEAAAGAPSRPAAPKVVKPYKPHAPCLNCRTVHSPGNTWREGPQGPRTLCNACGIKWKRSGQPRDWDGGRSRSSTSSGGASKPSRSNKVNKKAPAAAAAAQYMTAEAYMAAMAGTQTVDFDQQQQMELLYWQQQQQLYWHHHQQQQQEYQQQQAYLMDGMAAGSTAVPCTD